MNGLITMKKPNLLIVDDDRQFTNSVKTVLGDFKVTEVHSPREVFNFLAPDIDIILLDLVFNKRNPSLQEGLSLIPAIRKLYPDLHIVVLTNYPSIETTVQAIKAGATDFLNKKDLRWDEWKIRLMNYAKSSINIRDLKTRNRELEGIAEGNEILGNSKETEFLKLRLKDLAQNTSDALIFLCGETGTGKNHAARYFSKYSKRVDVAYREFSILELSDTLIESELFGHVKGSFTGATENKKGLFELAEGGILFLDEIGDYDLKIQTKILRFIDEKIITPVGSRQSKKLDLQLILASNQNIPDLIQEHKFREDLYQRINRIRIDIPPLRERVNDIPILTNFFFNLFREKEKTKLIEIDNRVREVFIKYYWPGNIRELQSVIWDACTKARLFGDTRLKIDHLKRELTENPLNSVSLSEPGKQSNLEEKYANMELQEIDNALQRSYGQKAAAAQFLGMNADQLRYKIFKYYKKQHINLQKYSNICKCYKL